MMKKITATTILSLLLLCTTVFTAQAQSYNGIVYVTPSGAGTHLGDSWANATSSIDTAQTLAQAHSAVVWVAAGIYYGDTTASNAFTMVEGVDVYGGFAGVEPANYNLMLRDFLTNETILDGDSVRRVLCQPGDFTTETMWNGFTIRNGFATYYYSQSTWQSVSEYGGGAYLRANGILSNCVLTHNSAQYDGGAIYATNAMIKNCIISHNVVTYESSYSRGGGVYAVGSTVTDCIIRENEAPTASGVYASSSDILNCHIEKNICPSYYSEAGGCVVGKDGSSFVGCTIENNISHNNGGGAFLVSSYMRKCNVLRNSSGGSGGGIYSTGSEVSHCTISHNSATGYGGGVYNASSSISNCLVSNNTSGSGGGVFVTRFYNNFNYYNENIIVNTTVVKNISAEKGAGVYVSSTALSLSNSIIWGNEYSGKKNALEYYDSQITCTHSAVEGGFVGEGNIYLSQNAPFNPLFVQPSLHAGSADSTLNADWHLQNGSVCINRGDNAVVTDSLDLSDFARIQRSTVDMGCYESDFEMVPQPEYEGIVYVTPSGAGNRCGNSWANATSSIEEAQEIALVNNAVVWVAAGTYYGDTISTNAFTMVEGVNVYGGFAGNEPADYNLSLRDFEVNATILDGQNIQRVLGQTLYFSSLTIWDGFVIQNGWSLGRGGGVSMGRNAMLSQCKIIHNYSGNGGGGVFCDGASVISDCDISENSSAIDGGGIEVWSNACIKNSHISHNISMGNGGGLKITYSSDTVVNCLISNNTALMKGGGISCSGSGIILNSTIVRNASEGPGAGVDGDASARLRNCIVWGNERNGVAENLSGCEITCSHSAVEGIYPGTNLIVLGTLTNQTPAFVNPSQNAGAEDTTLNVDWHLMNGSVCVNRGNNAFITDSTDIAGTARIINDTVDLGCYESEYYSVPFDEYAAEYQEVVYVTPTGAGQQTGADWDNAVSSINTAILIASTYGLDVWVAEGTYYGDTLDEIAFRMVNGVDVYGGFAGNEPLGYDLSLRDFETNTTILDGQYKQRVLYQSAGFDTTTVWDGFTIQHAYANSCVVMWAGSVLSNCVVSDNTSRGIYAENATVLNCRVLNNTASGYGAGIYAAYSNIVNCTVSNNATSSIAGGIYAIYSDIVNCTVSNNTTTSYSGGIYAYYSTLRNSTISENSSSGNGGGIYGYYSLVSNSIIERNFSTGNGGGLYCTGSYDTIRNCLVANNTSYGRGGGVFNNGGVNLINSTVVRNLSDFTGAGVYDGVTYSWNYPAQISNCIVWGNMHQNTVSDIFGTNASCSYTAVDLVEGWQTGDGVVVLRNSLSPGFVNPSLTAGISDSTSGVDWHLAAGSVCVNRGNDSLVVDSFDLDGTTRVKRDTVDLGCYESDYLGTGDLLQHVYVVAGGAGDRTGDSWENAVPTIEEALQLGQVYLSDVWVAAGTYYGDTVSTAENAFTMVDGVNVYGGFAGNEPADFDLSLRDFEANATILDGQNARRVLNQSNAFAQKTTWDGLVIQNGRVNGNGGGVYLRGNSVLSNCLVQNNVAYSPYSYEGRCGGGIYAAGSSSYSYLTSSYIVIKTQIRHCRIQYNKVEYEEFSDYSSGSYGGGVYASYADIECSEILFNTVQNQGGGIYLSYGAVLTNCLVANNTSLGGLGGGIYLNSGNVFGSTIVRNSSESYGAGIDISYYSTDTLKITNCIVWGNRTHAGLSSNVHGEDAHADYSFSAIEDEFECEGVVLLSEQNNQHPQFANPSQTAGWTDSTENVDWHLTASSVCINRGDNSAVIDSLDLDGTLRVKRDTVDMGCYESDYYSAPLTAYSGIVYVTQTGAGDRSGNSWENAKSSVNDAQVLASVYNAVVWVAAGTYYGDTDSTSENAFTMRDGVSVYGGFAGNEPATFDLSLRDFEANATILDGSSARRVLYQPENFNTRTVWDGFVIQNGYANGPGGGVYLQANSKLSNCLVQDNIANSQGSYGGGGVFVKGYWNADSSEVAYCKIRNNETRSHGHGGGLFALYTIVHHSTIMGNTTNTSSSYYGGGIYASNSKVSSCVISHNNAKNADNGYYYNHSYGGGIYLSSATLLNSLVVDNSAYYGGGVYGYGDIVNATVVSNNANSNAGVYMESSGCSLINSVVWGNRANGAVSNLAGSCHTIHSAVEGAVSGNDSVMILSGDNGGLEAGVNYPFFVSPQNGDYRLCKYSALVNAGDNNVQVPQMDLAGALRIFADTIDIGCYESQFESFCLPPLNLTVSEVTGTAALLSWQNPNPDNPYAFELSYKSEENPQWTSFLVSETNQYLLAGLQPQTVYTIRMRTLCDDITPTDYTDDICFATKCSFEDAHFDTIGDFTNNTYGEYLPVCLGSTYSYTQQLFLASEIGNERLLDTLTMSYYCVPNSYYYYFTTNTFYRNINVYMGHTQKASFAENAEFVPVDSMTLVYSGDLVMKYETGKPTIRLPLTYPFRYNGVDNLVIAFDDNTGSTSGSSYRKFYTHQTPDKYSKYSSSTVDIDPANPPLTGNRYNYRMSIILPGACLENGGCDLPWLSVSDVTESSAKVSLNPDANSQSVELQYKEQGDTLYQSIPIDSSCCLLTGLKQNKQYSVRARTLCEDTSSAWTYRTFTTLVKDFSRIYVTYTGQGEGDSWETSCNDINYALSTASRIISVYGHTPDIWVAAGIYYGDTLTPNAFTMIHGVNVYGGFAGNEPVDYDLSQRDVESNTTVLDGQNLQRVLYQSTNYSVQTIWDGFTIQNGYTSSYGGGAYLRSNAQLSHCKLINNHANYGGGAYVAGYGSVIKDCSVLENSAVYKGGGIQALSYSTVANCVISGNSTTNSVYYYYGGGGIYAEDATIVSCEISNNISAEKGGAINMTSTQVRNCLLSNNTSSDVGGAIYGSGQIINSTIVCNKSYGSSGGLYPWGTINLSNSIVWGNTSNDVPSNISGLGAIVCSHSAIEGGYEGDSIITLSAETPPLFVNPSLTAGVDDVAFNVDWHLLQGSPCINTGINSVVTDSLDLDGTARIKRDTVDMGCYESDYYSVPMAEYDSIIYVTVTGAGTQYGTVSGSGTFAFGDTVTLLAIPQQYARFVRWSDNDTTNPRILVAERDTIFTAVFELYLPELHVTSISPSEFVGGQSATISWTVRNDGTAPTPNGEVWYDRVWLSVENRVAAFDNDPILLGEFPNVAALAPGESYTQTQSFDIPLSIAGSYYLFVISDAYDAHHIYWDSVMQLPYNPPAYIGANSHHCYGGDCGNYAGNRILEISEVGNYPYYHDNFFYELVDIGIPALPDLKVDSVRPETQNFFSGSIVGLTFKVTNHGNYDTRVTEWKDVIFISNHEVFDETAQIVGIVPRTSVIHVPDPHTPSAPVDSTSGKKGIVYQGVLLPDSSYQVSTSVMVPLEMYGTAYFYVYTDYYNQVYEHVGQFNNVTRSDSVNIYVKPPADLVPQNITADNLVSTGATFNYSYEIHNIGAGNPSSGSWIDMSYLSTSADSLENAIPIASDYHTEGLSIGGYYSVQKSIPLPSDMPNGTYYLFVFADANNHVLEYFYEDNNLARSSQPIAVVKPDLQILSLNVEDSLSAGAEFGVSYMLANTGDGAVINRNVKDGFFLSQSPNGADAIQMPLFSSNTWLNAHDSTVKYQNVMLPGHLFDGYYYLFARTNVDNALNESNTNNNQSPIRQVYVNHQPLPDLVIHSVTTPDTIVAGLPTSFVVRLANNGEKSASLNNLDFQLSAAATYTPILSTIENVSFETESLSVGDTITVSLTVRVSPAVSNPSSFTLTVNPDHTISESNYSNNGYSFSHSVQPYPFDLAVTHTSSPDHTVSGESIPVEWTVQNQGLAPAPTVPMYMQVYSQVISFQSNFLYHQWQDYIYLSADSLFDASDVQIGVHYQHQTLYAGNSYTQNLNCQIPVTADGDYYVLVVSDASNLTFDSQRANNVRGRRITIIPSTLPDLRMDTLDAPDVLTSGSTCPIHYSVSNKGEHITHGDQWTDAFYINSQPTLQNAHYLGSKYHYGQLDTAANYTGYIQVLCPNSMNGECYLIGVTDATNQIMEMSNDSNNIFILLVSVSRPLPCDLTVLPPDIPQSANVGDEVQISWTLQNVGLNVAQGDIKDAVYLSTDSSWSSDDFMLGTETYSVSLAADGQEQRSITVLLQGVPIGDYYVVVRTNILNALNESSYANNKAVSLLKIHVGYPSLYIDQEEQLQLADNQTVYYKLEVGPEYEHQTLSCKLSTSVQNVANSLYIAFSSAPSASHFDWSATMPYVQEQEILIPSLEQGTYYIMAKGHTTDNSVQSVTLLASIINFEIISVNANTGTNTGSVTTQIIGAKFDTIMDFRLANSNSYLPAEKVFFHNSTESYATFNLRDQETGVYDMVAELPGGIITVKGQAFVVETGLPAELLTHIVAPASVRNGNTFTVTIEYGNNGSTDLDVSGFLLVSPNGFPIAFESDSLVNNATELTFETAEPNGNPDVIRPGHFATKTIFVKANRTGNINLKLYPIRRQY